MLGVKELKKFSLKKFFAWIFVPLALFLVESFQLDAICCLAVKGATKLYSKHNSYVVIILFNTGLWNSAFSTNSFGKLLFLSLKAYCVFCLFYTLHNHCFCSHLFSSNLLKQISHYKALATALNKKYASRELLSI